MGVQNRQVFRRNTRQACHDTENRNSAIAAAVLLAVFGLGAFYLPTVMVAVGNLSTIAAGIIAVLFVAAFFGVFWLRGRSQRKRDELSDIISAAGRLLARYAVQTRGQQQQSPRISTKLAPAISIVA